MNYSNTTIIIPTLNEEKNMKNILSLLEKQYVGINIIIADDGSKDKTQEVVLNKNKKNKNIVLLDRSKKKVKGLTASVVDAIQNTKTKYFVVMDGDLQHPPNKIKNIINELEKGCMVVVGEREKIIVNWQWYRKIISKTAIILGKIRLFGKSLKINDLMSGFFGANTDFVKKLLKNKRNKFEMRGYKVLFDILKVLPKNTKIGSVKFQFGLRKEGESKIGQKQIILYMRSLFK